MSRFVKISQAICVCAVHMILPSILADSNMAYGRIALAVSQNLYPEGIHIIHTCIAITCSLGVL